MVGAVILARATEDPELAEEILNETRAWIEAGDLTAPPAGGETLGNLGPRGRPE